MLALDVLSLFALGLLVGVEFSVSAFINPLLGRLDPSPQQKAIQLSAERLGAIMPVWYGAILLLLLAETVVRHGTSVAPVLIASDIVWALVILATIFVLVPINNRLRKPAPTQAPSETFHFHHRWDRLHRIRVLLLSLVFLAVLFALLA